MPANLRYMQETREAMRQLARECAAGEGPLYDRYCELIAKDKEGEVA